MCSRSIIGQHSHTELCTAVYKSKRQCGRLREKPIPGVLCVINILEFD